MADISEVDLGIIRKSMAEHPLPESRRDTMRAAVVIDDSLRRNVGTLWVKFGEIVDHAERRVFEDIDAARNWVAKNKIDE